MVLALTGALLAGALTTLAPCVLPLLPVTVGGSLAAGDHWSGKRRAVLVTAALGASVVAFTLLLKVGTALIDVPAAAWTVLSGALLIALGVAAALPAAWDRLSGALGLAQATGGRLGAARRRSGPAGALLTGAALGPVFSSCSPWYGYVVVTALPAEPAYGLVLLVAYTLGLCATLLAVALAGQRLIRRLGWAADAHGAFRRGLGVVFVLVGVTILLGWDRAAQAWIIENTPLAPWTWVTVPAP